MSAEPTMDNHHFSAKKQTIFLSKLLNTQLALYLATDFFWQLIHFLLQTGAVREGIHQSWQRGDGLPPHQVPGGGDEEHHEREEDPGEQETGPGRLQEQSEEGSRYAGSNTGKIPSDLNQLSLHNIDENILLAQ